MPRQIPDWVTGQPLAHRGLHDETAGVVENTPAAFEAAAEAGYGIELDVQLTADGEAIVFHDTSLERLTFSGGNLNQMTAADLQALPLKNTTDRIPTLEAVLAQINGRVPLLVELKSFSPNPTALEQRVAEILADYNGPFAVQSFNPRSVEWFAKNQPKWVRGQLGMKYKAGEFPQISAVNRFVLSNLLLSGLSRPDFIAFEWSALPSIAPGFARWLGLPVIAWTLKQAADWDQTRSYANNLIFEGFHP